MNMSYEEIINQLFPNVIISNSEGIDVGELYWSGVQYINIFLNYRIPLRTIFLLLPLKEMCSKYDIYHEMNEIELCKDFISNNYKNVSILRYFRKQAALSTRELSKLSNIPVGSINYYETDNTSFYKASGDSLFVLKNVLNIPITFLKKKTDFVPITHSLLTSDDYASCLKETISELLNEKIDKLDITFDVNQEYNKNAVTLYMGSSPIIIYKRKKIYMPSSIMNRLLSNSTDKYIIRHLTTNLVF